MSRTPERLDPPRVTVLMAVYNGQDHVRQAVEGILAQTFSDFEFIIVDDGSTDETSRELDAFTDSRIVRLKHESNRGLIAALNTGLAAARGEFVARQDADDFSYPGRLQAQVNFLEARSDVAVVGTDTVFEGWEGGGRTNRIVERDPLRLAWILLFYCPLTHSSIMFRTAVIQELGGYNGDDVHAEDFGLWARAARSSRVATVTGTHVLRRRPPGSITERWSVEMGRAARRVSLQNLRWVLGTTASTASLDTLEALFGNRFLGLADAARLDMPALRLSISQLLNAFSARFGLEQDGSGFRRWACQWMSAALLRKSQRLLRESATRSGGDRALGLRTARTLIVHAIKLSPAVIASRTGAAAALRAMLSHA